MLAEINSETWRKSNRKLGTKIIGMLEEIAFR